jgi:pimeloyl-ACP methyl ester carboxylesterase
MKGRKTVRAVAAVLLIGGGFGLAVPSPYREHRYLLDAGGCRMETDVVERQSGEAHGAVVLFHGISANKKIMSYVARGFAEAGLRVYVPDFPGHGHTPGPFSPARVEQCGEAFVRELLARSAIGRDRMILAGHSMGGAVAVRIAPRVSVAGVIAISPAPMIAAHGAEPEMLLFTNPPRLAPNSLVMSGQFEPVSMRGNAADLVASSNDGSSKYLQIPKATHVSMLFNSAVVRAAQDWSARVLKLPSGANLPSHRPLIGALGGFVGILLLAGPFLRELMSKRKGEESGSSDAPVALWQVLLEFAAGSILIVLVLRYWNALKVIGLFEGDYLAGFVLLLGCALIAMHWRSLRIVFGGSSRGILTGAFAAIVLHLLVTGWFELTFYEAWLTAEKWERFPFLLIALLPYHLVEEHLLGRLNLSSRWHKLAAGMTLRFIGWGALMGGVLLLHSGEILIALLAPYLVIFNILQRTGMDMVHEECGSTAAAALFGAILATGFLLVIFPLTGGSLT